MFKLGSPSSACCVGGGVRGRACFVGWYMRHEAGSCVRVENRCLWSLLLTALLPDRLEDGTGFFDAGGSSHAREELG